MWLVAILNKEYLRQSSGMLRQIMKINLITKILGNIKPWNDDNVTKKFLKY